MSLQTTRKSLPAWAIACAVLGALVLITLWGWRAFTANNLPTGPTQAVRPGMVDFVKEAQSGNVTRERQDLDDEKETSADHENADRKNVAGKGDKD